MSGAPTAPARSTRTLLGRFAEGAPPVSEAGAAVTIVLRDGAREPEVLLIERTVNPNDPGSGQVALPGGRVDPADATLAATAIRELGEEVGLLASDLDGPPRFVRTELAARFGLRVAIFAAALDPMARPPAVASPREVAHVFWLRGGALAETRRVFTETVRGRAEVPAAVVDGHLVWGFTRRILRDFFELPPEGDEGGPMFAPARSTAGP
ncbi:MAG TPA: CoA pyrophosphatase [Thermoplasmata archaeon]|nr:CoA pyrophosphatase [Thermoplasmata archaeon]